MHSLYWSQIWQKTSNTRLFDCHRGTRFVLQQSYEYPFHSYSATSCTPFTHILLTPLPAPLSYPPLLQAMDEIVDVDEESFIRMSKLDQAQTKFDLVLTFIAVIDEHSMRMQMAVIMLHPRHEDGLRNLSYPHHQRFACIARPPVSFFQAPVFVQAPRSLHIIPWPAPPLEAPSFPSRSPPPSLDDGNDCSYSYSGDYGALGVLSDDA